MLVILTTADGNATLTTSGEVEMVIVRHLEDRAQLDAVDLSEQLQAMVAELAAAAQENTREALEPSFNDQPRALDQPRRGRPGAALAGVEPGEALRPP